MEEKKEEEDIKSCWSHFWPFWLYCDQLQAPLKFCDRATSITAPHLWNDLPPKFRTHSLNPISIKKPPFSSGFSNYITPRAFHSKLVSSLQKLIPSSDPQLPTFALNDTRLNSYSLSFLTLWKSTWAYPASSSFSFIELQTRGAPAVTATTEVIYIIRYSDLIALGPMSFVGKHRFIFSFSTCILVLCIKHAHKGHTTPKHPAAHTTTNHY